MNIVIFTDSATLSRRKRAARSAARLLPQPARGLAEPNRLREFPPPAELDSSAKKLPVETPSPALAGRMMMPLARG